MRRTGAPKRHTLTKLPYGVASFQALFRAPFEGCRKHCKAEARGDANDKGTKAALTGAALGAVGVTDYSELTNAIKASRSAVGNALKVSTTFEASPPCQSTASSTLAARPSCSRLALAPTVVRKPMLESGEVRHSDAPGGESSRSSSIMPLLSAKSGPMSCSSRSE